MTPRYNWNIVESGIKHHQTNKLFIWKTIIFTCCHCCSTNYRYCHRT